MLQTSPNQRYSFSARIHHTPPPGRRNNPNPNPVVHRRNWIQKYKKRPNQLNIDETSVTGIRFSSVYYSTYFKIVTPTQRNKVINTNKVINVMLIGVFYFKKIRSE